MGRGGRIALKRRNNHHVRMKNMDSEDSDEDYVAEADEIDEQSDELNSLVGEASEEESCFEGEDEEDAQVDEEEDDEEEVFEEEDEEEEEEEEEWRTVVKPRPRKGPSKSKKNSIKRSKKRRKVICDDDEDSDYDDEEFTPHEIDSLEEEEEEFPLPKKETKKRGRPTLKGKRSARKRRRKTSAKPARKPPRKKSKRTGNLRRGAKSGDDEDITEEGPILRGRSRKKPVHRKKRVIGSDSDLRSDSSDYDFTISEEEREQIREANDFCGSLTTNLRSSRRNLEDDTFCKPRKLPVRKGKEKAEEIKNDVGKPVCGICLTEEGKNTVRGLLNCCSHYFCFACIMEWSKVESRCPLCKQRFVTISKPARCVKGFDLRNSVIQIPERDQVYQPSEEELRDFLNPYENVICTECHLGGDDALMLLCDVCDSPAHTYCVGLGREVPEGNWYCDGCRPVALGSSHSQARDLTPDRRTSVNASYGATSYENMAEIDLNVTIPETPVSQGNGFLSSPRYTGGGFQASSPASGMGVSTVSGRRRIHRQIRVLLSSRLGQVPPGADLDSLRSILGAASALQQSRMTDIGSSNYAEHVDRLHENPNNVQNRNLFAGRPDHIVGHLGQASTSTGSSNGHLQWDGLERMNLGNSQTLISGSEQLRPRPGRSSVGIDISVCPSLNQVEDQTCIVKQQVQSIVNSQLKNLSQDLNLGRSDYAIILSRATDTMMVAYELESPRRDILQIVRPNCLHVNSLRNIQISPMNECCLSCLENFAKEIVKGLMNTTLGPAYWLQFR